MKRTRDDLWLVSIAGLATFAIVYFASVEPPSSARDLLWAAAGFGCGFVTFIAWGKVQEIEPPGDF